MTDQNRNDDDRKKEAPSGHSQPIDPPVPDEERYRLDTNAGRRGGVTDAGRTSGGGSLGHVQPEKVEREAPLRNNADDRKSDEPTLPSNDASLNTKI
jgi:hypothetical protein